MSAKFQGCSKKVPMLFNKIEVEGCLKDVQQFNRCVREDSMVFQGCLKEVSKKFQGSFKIVSRKFQVYFKKFQGISGKFQMCFKGV